MQLPVVDDCLGILPAAAAAVATSSRVPVASWDRPVWTEETPERRVPACAGRGVEGGAPSCTGTRSNAVVRYPAAM